MSLRFLVFYDFPETFQSFILSPYVPPEHFQHVSQNFGYNIAHNVIWPEMKFTAASTVADISQSSRDLPRSIFQKMRDDISRDIRL